MKRVIIMFVIIYGFMYGVDWGDEVRLTDNPGGSYTTFHSIGAGGNYVHIVWSDNMDGHRAIYYIRSCDNGETWDEAIKISKDSDTLSCYQPSIAVEDSCVYVAWSKEDGEIYINISYDNGESWEGERRLTYYGGPSSNPQVEAEGDRVYVMWLDGRDDGVVRVYMKVSDDRGKTWGVYKRLTSESDSTRYNVLSFSFDVDGDTLVLIFQVYGGHNMGYRRSFDGGETWGEVKWIGGGHEPQIGVSGRYVHVVSNGYASEELYSDLFNMYLYYDRSRDGGDSWDKRDVMVEMPVSWVENVIEVRDDNVYLLWRGYVEGVGGGLLYRYSWNNGWSWGEIERVTGEEAVLSSSPSIAVSNGYIHVVWTDLRDENYEIYYTRGRLEGIKEELTSGYGGMRSMFVVDMGDILREGYELYDITGKRIEDYGGVSEGIYFGKKEDEVVKIIFKRGLR